MMGLFTKVVKVFVNVKRLASTSAQTNAKVTVQQGVLRGAVKKLIDGSPYYSFKGIPYASPPIGKLRFKAPLPPESWRGIYDASEHGHTCPQFKTNIGQYKEGNEDCLYLNVYTKSLQRDSKLSVIVYIHGGAFMTGSGNTCMYGPEFLLQHDVILVTINYRLEALGFLCLDTPEVPGNAGMKDQVAALQWIQSNIEQFGGDPNNVTICGGSAGAVAVTYHILSPMSKELYHKAIAQSGLCIADWAQGKDGRERAIRAAKILGKETEDSEELLDFFQSLDVNELIRLTFKSLTNDEKHRGYPTHFCPVVEKKLKNTTSFLSEELLTLLQSGKINKVPLIIGYNSADGLFLTEYEIKRLKFMNKNPSFYLPREIARKIPQEVLKDFGKRIMKFYSGGREITENDLNIVEKMQTDIHIAYNCHRFSHYYSSFCESIFSYKFDCDTDLNIYKRILGFKDYKGASHMDEVFYLFKNEMNKYVYEEQEILRDLIYNITKMWTDFAKTGNPTPDDSLGFKWLPFTTKNKEYLNINKEGTCMSRYADQERVEFWNELYREAGLPCISN